MGEQGVGSMESMGLLAEAEVAISEVKSGEVVVVNRKGGLDRLKKIFERGWVPYSGGSFGGGKVIDCPFDVHFVWRYWLFTVIGQLLPIIAIVVVGMAVFRVPLIWLALFPSLTWMLGGTIWYSQTCFGYAKRTSEAFPGAVEWVWKGHDRNHTWKMYRGALPGDVRRWGYE